jgi:Flp pilus assembly protein TadD
VKRLGLALVLVASIAHAGVEDDLRDGDRYFENGEWQKSGAAIDRAIAKAPGQVPAVAWGKRAAVYIILKNYRAGLELIARAKQRHPGAPEILEQEALILWETDRRTEAIAVAEQVVATRPETFTNQKLIGEHYSARDPAKTMVAFEAYLANRPSNLESGDVLPRLRLGFAYLATARTVTDGDPKALYGKAAQQFEVVQQRHASKPNALANADNGLCAAYTGLERFDAAVTVCERIVKDPKRIDAAASAWFNLATAYLLRKNLKGARASANEFVKLRRGEARGYLLLGDVQFEAREWPAALDSYGRAEKLAKADQTREKVRISIGLGKTYRRLPVPQPALAIEKLSAAFAANPTNTELAIELGGAYLETKQDPKVVALLDGVIGSASFASAGLADRAAALVLAGKARFNTRDLERARSRFEEAHKLRPAELAIRRALVLTINEQAVGKDPKAARALLDQAAAIDPASPVTVANYAVLSLAAGDCDGARAQLATLEGIRGHDATLRLRLLAKSYTCGAKPDLKRASETYAAAEKAARRLNASVAELYVEWAPLLWDADPDDAVAKLETALRGSDPELAVVARRNLALALYRRGWKRLRDGKAAESVADFERARDPGLKGTELQIFELSYALALLDANRAAEAAKVFKALLARGDHAQYLKPPFAKIPGLFTAYANYRTGTLAARQQAATELTKLEGEAQAFGPRLRELLAGTWEAIAYDQWRAGQLGAARRSLDSADKYATGDIKRRTGMDRLALDLVRADPRTLEALGGNPIEVLVNLGIVYDLRGRHKEALEAWQRARGRVQVRDLQRWIDAKKRIHGL